MNAYELGEAAWARAETSIGFTAYDGEVPKNPDFAYVVLHRPTGRTIPDRAGDLGDRRLFHAFYLTCVGLSPGQCGNTVELVRARFTGWRPHPNGSPLRESDTGAPIARDDSGPGPTRFSVPVRYTLTTPRSPT